MASETSEPLSPEQFQAIFPVSRETIAKFELYLNLLSKWNTSINLVSKRSLSDPWRRHILDSAQIAPLIPDDVEALVDVGSGAGLPGLVLAMLRPEINISLVEADQRKAVFLREAARITNCEIRVYDERIEEIIDLFANADMFTARALAPLPTLLKLIKPALNQKKLCIFPKTGGINIELKDVEADWIVSSRMVQSLSDPRGQIAILEAQNRE